MKKVIIPLPDLDFDPTEVAIPWKMLTEAGVQVVFSTPSGKPSAGDPEMLETKRMGKLLGLFVGAKPKACAAYREMEKSQEFLGPITFDQMINESFDGMHLPGGHAPGMRQYLESKQLQDYVGKFFVSGKPLSIVCHGIVLAARSKNPQTGKSVLDGLTVTGLPESMEMTAFRLSNSFLSKEKMGNYYLTYPNTTVEQESREAVGKNGEFKPGPGPTLSNLMPGGYVVECKNVVTGRWPKDVPDLTRAFLKKLSL